MTDADPIGNPPKEPSSLAWGAIAAGILGGLALTFVLGFGVRAKWGSPQWGPLADWLAGAATFGAVVVALRGVTREQRARLVDHELARRRECITALGDLWAALVSVGVDFLVFVDYLDGIPTDFNPTAPCEVAVPAPPGHESESVADEYIRNIQNFFRRWTETIEPPLFVALALVYGTPVNDGVARINSGINEIRAERIPQINTAVLAGRRPDTKSLRENWNSVLALRSEHLSAARHDLSLALVDVERSLRRNGHPR